MRNHPICALAACLSFAGAACKQANRTDQRSQDNQAKLTQPEHPQAQPPQAQPPQAQPPQQPAEQAAKQQGTVSGSVSQVGANDITVGQPGGAAMHFFVDSTAAVTLDGQKASLGEIPAGAQAIVIFTTQGDQQKAQRIDAQTRQPVRGTEENEQQPKQQPMEQRPNDQQPNDQRPNDHEQP